MRPILLFLALLTSSHALEFARPFGSHMVLPMNREVPVWGTAEPLEEVQVSFGLTTWTTHASAEGRWRITLAPLPASDLPSELKASSPTARIVLQDILVGQVWLCSGQSNMDFQLSKAVGGKQEASFAGRQKNIRLFNLTGAPTDGRRYDTATLARLNGRDHFQGSWERATQGSAGYFSAVAWWTGRILSEHYGVPVGLVENAVGGSGTEAWLPLDLLEADPAYQQLLGSSWYQAGKLSPWCRERAKENLGAHLEEAHPFKPGFLFESGVRDFARFPFDGVLWYQGETNAEIPDMAWQVKVMSDLVNGWRRSLQQPHLPFYMVQLPRIGGNDPLRQNWPEYRKAQAKVAATLKGVTLVVTQDLGWDSPDVHPPDKLPVAQRLAGAILRH
ncbi:sialate O-acetylesterase [Luteolibacter luteus]|uniref:Sialate O-acetylesterase n=1 Tax=Luteolibacter luteus TaxID=2728835 RepID=A0A858RFE1_9BACT|nr:sialate O-acetylesterase [Luteolibacter luteus]QJE95284.1 sialate O-acetylesterase [Luteolibacter luteus]